MEHIFHALDQIMETLGDEKIYGIGIGAIGPMDKNRGKILAPPNFYGLHDLEIAREIEEHCHMPVFLMGRVTVPRSWRNIMAQERTVRILFM